MRAASPSWALVATVKAPVEKVMAFLAWHFAQGAAHISLCFDQPDDPALDACRPLAAPDRLSLIACDESHWQRLNGRPERHQNRQAKNARYVYQRCRADWLGHLDVDEFLWSDQPLDRLLGTAPPSQIQLRAEPYEAMHDPALGDDIYTARQFRAALKPRHAALRPLVLGRFADILPEAMLSHSAGKAFFRTGIDQLSPRLHGAFLNGERLQGPGFEPGLKLLHFHAQDRNAWTAALPFRLARGAYQYHPALQAFLLAAETSERDAFYEETQMLTPEKSRALHRAGRLMEADLALRAQVRALQSRGAA